MVGAPERMCRHRLADLVGVDPGNGGVHIGARQAGQLSRHGVTHQGVAEPIPTGLRRRLGDQTGAPRRLEPGRNLAGHDTQDRGETGSAELDAQQCGRGQGGAGGVGGKPAIRRRITPATTSGTWSPSMVRVAFSNRPLSCNSRVNSFM